MMDFRHYKVQAPKEKETQFAKSTALFLSITLFVILIVFLSVFGIKKVIDIKTFNEKPVITGTAKQTDAYKTTLINSYLPDKDFVFLEKYDLNDAPEIVAKYAFLVNINNGEVLYKKDQSKKVPIASLVKIMTAVVAVEHKNLTDTVTISNKAANIGENSMGITEGEVYTLEELLYGLFLHSGNDAATAIAEGTAGDVETFTHWMNIKGKELGLTNSYFADPSGLNDKTYSTAEDLVKLTGYALKYTSLRKIAKTVEYSIDGTDNHKYIPLYNQTNLLTTYPGVEGFKTGYTEEAGLCLVTYAQNNDVELVGVVLNSIDRKGDMVQLLDHGFGKYGIEVDHAYKFE